MAKTISFLNFKGGVGKTTSAVNVAAAMHLAGYRVLVVDADPQGNASRMCGFNHATDTGALTLADVLAGKATAANAILMDGDNDGSFDYIPATSSLYYLANQRIPENTLAKALDAVARQYDYIIIDCPPDNNRLTLLALCASRHIIVPLNGEVFALDGMGVISARVAEVAQNLRPGPQILGYVITRYDNRLTLHRQMRDEMQRNFPSRLFSTVIRTNISLAESPALRTNVFAFSPQSRGAKDYKALANEIINKINP